MADPVSIDVPGLLQALSPDAPCGDNLEYDPVFLALEEALAGKPEVQYGDTIAEAQPPDWKSVRELALQLFGRSRDLRVALALARAALQLDGMAGFAAGLALIEGLLTDHWDSVHPQLDPDDDNDPMVRVNTIAALVDESSVLRELRQVAFIESRAHGRFSLRDIEIASGELQAGDDEGKPSTAVVDAACMDVDIESLRATLAALQAAHASVLNIEAVLTRQVGAGQSLDLAPLAKALKRMKDFLGERVARRDPAAATPEDAQAPGAHAPEGASPARAISGDIASREDVLRMLDKLNAYYARHEPSSPVPLLLRRAQRLVNMEFIDIIRDLAPDGVEQLCKVAGISQES